MTQTHDFCNWCHAKVRIPKNRNPKRKLVCSRGCKDAETLFELLYNDEEQNRRTHYHDLTSGDDYG